MNYVHCTYDDRTLNLSLYKKVWWALLITKDCDTFWGLKRPQVSVPSEEVWQMEFVRAPKILLLLFMPQKTSKIIKKYKEGNFFRTYFWLALWYRKIKKMIMLKNLRKTKIDNAKKSQKDLIFLWIGLVYNI